MVRKFSMLFGKTKVKTKVGKSVSKVKKVKSFSRMESTPKNQTTQKYKYTPKSPSITYREYKVMGQGKYKPLTVGIATYKPIVSRVPITKPVSRAMPSIVKVSKLATKVMGAKMISQSANGVGVKLSKNLAVKGARLYKFDSKGKVKKSIMLPKVYNGTLSKKKSLSLMQRLQKI